MADEPDAQWIKTGFTDSIEPGSRRVFGVILEARVCDPGVSAFFKVQCSDGTVVNYEFVYPLNPIEALGGLVALELTKDDQVGARRFKAVYDFLESHTNGIKKDARRIVDREKRRNAVPRSPAMSTYHEKGVFECEQGTIIVTVVTELFGLVTIMTPEMTDKIENYVSKFGETPMSLQRAVKKVTVLVKPLIGKSFSRTVPTAELSTIFGGAWPNSESWAAIVEKLKNR